MDIPPTITIDKEDPQPLYWQLYWQLRQLILQGAILPGMPLPASRKLAHQIGVARVTVTQALAQLAAEGYVVRKQGAGTFVADHLPVSTHQKELGEANLVTPLPLSEWGKRVSTMLEGGAEGALPVRYLARAGETAVSDIIDFGFGRTFAHIFPYDIWRRLLARYLSTDDIILARYGSVAGFAPLREAVADHLGRLRGVRCTPDQVVIVSGAQQTLDIISRLLLNQGDTVLVETPGYRDAFELFRTHGARLIALPVDEEGFPVAQIPPDTVARLAFVTPSNQFPHGGTMSLTRRLALLAWACRQNAFVIEDDYDGELRYDGHPHTALQGLDENGRVIYLGTFSKVLFPALRLAYAVLPPALVAPFVQAKRLIDRGAPTLTQAAVADFIQGGHFDRHLRHLRDAYGQRRRTLIQALQTYLPECARYSSTAAGLHVMLYLDEDCDEADVVRRAAEQGVRVYPGTPYHVQQPAPPSILLGFSGLSEADIEEGVRRLAEAIT
ncbi:MAG: PLP-dependent aminotransferase family protein [Anaerolineales bacterium]|nr:PLP-dependent aminotransferase family protein [Anaerolineales bacterium]